jgi:hypothetical protein
MVRQQNRRICNIYKLIRRRYRRWHMCRRSGDISRKCGKKKHNLIKDDITGYVDTIRRNMKAFIPFMERTIKNVYSGVSLRKSLVVFSCEEDV